MKPSWTRIARIVANEKHLSVNSRQRLLFICVHLRLSAVFCSVSLLDKKRGNHLALGTQVAQDEVESSSEQTELATFGFDGGHSR